jgi:phage shock protein A
MKKKEWKKRAQAFEKENIDLNERLKNPAFIICAFCGLKANSIESVRAHSAGCIAHPAVIKAKQLQAEVGRLCDDVNEANATVAGLHEEIKKANDKVARYFEEVSAAKMAAAAAMSQARPKARAKPKR